MKKLNKHPRLFKKTALTLKKLIATKIKSMRLKKFPKDNSQQAKTVKYNLYPENKSNEKFTIARGQQS
jgi:hypothetical protein